MTAKGDSKCSKPAPLVAHDLTPMDGLNSADEAWLHDLVQQANTDTLSLSFSSARELEQAPIAYFDGPSGKWWAGRFVGEVTHKGRTLTILPRFGMPALRRWLSRIWGVRLMSSTGKYTEGRVWLWELIARLWTDRLLVAAKHGLPRVRVDELHIGPTIRGRLLVRQSATKLHSGQKALVSRTRNRRIDSRIGGILLGAFEHLRRELRHVGSEQHWLTDRASTLIKELQNELDRHMIAEEVRLRAPVRYKPITEAYMPVVELSQAIIGGRPFMSSSEGNRQVYGVLLDMAEIWELFLFHLLRDGLSFCKVIHSGRSPEAAFWLLKGSGADKLGALKPDILMSSRDQVRQFILDAKYKLTTWAPGRPEGILREDLYQMTSYLSANAAVKGTVGGALVYPSSEEIKSLERRGPFHLAGCDATFAFLGLNCQPGATEKESVDSEVAFITAVRSLLTAVERDMIPSSSHHVALDPQSHP